jgi:hypothetical protein
LAPFWTICWKSLFVLALNNRLDLLNIFTKFKSE